MKLIKNKDSKAMKQVNQHIETYSGTSIRYTYEVEENGKKKKFVLEFKRMSKLMAIVATGIGIVIYLWLKFGF